MDAVYSFSKALTVDTNIYASGDNVGGLQTVDLSPFKNTKGAAILDHVLIMDLAKQSANMDLVLFGSNPSATTFTTNVAQDIADADITKIIGVVPVTSHHVFADSSVSRAVNLDLGFKLDATQSTLNLYAALISRATPTFATTGDIDLTMTFRAPSSW